MSQLDGMLSAQPLPPSRNRRSRARRVVALVVILGFAAIVVLGFRLVRGSGEDAFSGPGTGTATVVIEPGDSLRVMGEKLVAAGVVSSADDFVEAAAAQEQSSTIGPGRYTLRQQMGAPEAVALLLDPASHLTAKVVLPEGLRLRQSLRAAAEGTGIPLDDFKAVVKEPEELGLPDWAKGKVEGFLFPATYQVPDGSTATEVLQQFTARFAKASADLDLEQRAAAIGKTPYEVLIIASLVEAEVKPQDFRKVAAVIENRLADGMPLQLDATVAYGLGVVDLQLSSAQLEQDTPYNTYTRTGLPPTPINSPGEAAIEAALSPAKGNWLYYVTVDPTTGETKFAKSYDRFLEFKAELQRNLAKSD